MCYILYIIYCDVLLKHVAGGSLGLRCETQLTYMQGMNLVMATCFRELKDETAALRVFDFVVRQAKNHSEIYLYNDQIVPAGAVCRSFYYIKPIGTQHKRSGRAFSARAL